MPDPRLLLIPQLYRIFLTPITAIGIIGNTFNIIVLTRRGLYNNPCSRYFIALASNNLFFSTFFVTFNLLSIGYSLDPTGYSRILCKLILFVQQTSMVVSPYFIVLAAIDRFLASSISARRRNLSNLTVARWAISFILIFFSLFFISSLVLLEPQPGQMVPCRISAVTLYGRIYPIMQIVFLSVIPPILMVIFGLLTIYNTKQVNTVTTGDSRFRRTQYELIRMLLAQVICFLIVCTPLGAIYIIGFLAITILSPIDYYFWFRMAQMLYMFSYATSVFLYFLSASLYRKQLVYIIKKLLRLNTGAIYGSTNGHSVQPWTIKPTKRSRIVPFTIEQTKKV
ncbi:unnamed protein product [Rotaria sp. Silwood2]|nr:unnamed protein product [Rotaria sp. Silwood2]CAF4381222.1 unnamed protein product [Rotaria sp. Silwood2]